MTVNTLARISCRQMHCVIVTAGLAALIVAGVADAAAPVTGDYWAYRVLNGYNREVRGKLDYRVDRADTDRVAVAVTTDNAALGSSRTEVYAARGGWIRHPLINHDQYVDYEFAQPYPAYDFPLDSGKSWSTRVGATNTATHQRVSVRVDGEVLGAERITVPAGTFDTIKIRRRIYAGDFDGSKAETAITETEWYAPALGRAVRLESNSGYMDQARCSDEMSSCTPVRGDWHIFELVETGAAR
ncbi:MAG: hypothetical protein ABIS45_07350 [Burkholderiales bacterium]